MFLPKHNVLKISIFAIYLVTVAFLFNNKVWVVPTDCAVLQALTREMDYVSVASNRACRGTG